MPTVIHSFDYTYEEDPPPAVGDTPIVDAGQPQEAFGPPPSVITLEGTYTAGAHTDTPTYLWEQVDGPVGNATIESDTSLETDVTFAAYVPGTYVFRLTATAEDTETAFVYTPNDTVIVVIGDARAPIVESRSVQIVLPTTTYAAALDVDDDGWGGALSYAWEQLAGPDAATIASPTSLTTNITFSGELGSYIFALSVSQADSDFVGAGYLRVTVYAADIPDDWNSGEVTVTANGVPVRGIVETCRISKQVGQPSTCTFQMYGANIEYGNEVVLERGGVRLFGGICLTEGFQIHHGDIVIYQPQMVGFAWHMTRVRVTQSFQGESITDVVLALLALCPGGITDEYVAEDLPTINVTFDDVSVAEALTQLTQMTTPRAHWHVDDYKRLHYAIVETLGGDPIPISSGHHSKRRISLTQDMSQMANRVILHYDHVTTLPAMVDEEIQVESLEGYSLGGGITTIDGNTITYTGTRSGPIDPVFGTLGFSFNVICEMELWDVDGLGLDLASAPSYGFTVMTELGETQIFSTNTGLGSMGVHNAIRFTLLPNWTPGQMPYARITGFGIYRNVAGEGYVLVGVIPPLRRARFIDDIAADDLDALIPPPTENTADEIGYWLTGCSGSRDIHTPAVVTVEDTAAQAALATRLGGGDDGIIELSLTAGTMTDDDAQAVANAYLAQSKDALKRFTVEVRDDNANPGQNLSVNLPSPIGALDLKIQQADIQGFTYGVPHYHAVVAADELVSIDDLLKR